MGFLDKVKELLSGIGSEGKDNEDTGIRPEDISLEYTGVRTWLDGVSGPILSGIDEHVSTTLESMTGIKEQLKKDTHRLSDAKIDEMRDKRMERAVINNRKALVSKLNTFINSIDTSGVDAAEAPAFFDSVKSEVARFMTDTKKNFYFVDTGLPSACESIKDDLLELSKKIDESIAYLAPLRDKIASITGSHSIIEELDNGFQKKKELEKSISSDKKKLKDLSRSRDTLEKDIKDLDKGADAAHYKHLNEEHKKVLDEIDEVKGKILQSLSVISRALKKYSRVAQLPGKEEEQLLELYITDPVYAVESDDSLSLLKSVASDLEMHVSRGSISLKDKLREKTINAITRLKNENDLEILRNELKGLKDTQAGIKKRIDSDPSIKKRKELKLNLARLSTDIDTLESGISSKEKMTDSLDPGMKSKIARLEKMLSAIGNYRVSISH